MKELYYNISVSDDLHEVDLKSLVRLISIENSPSLIFKNNYLFYYDLILSKQFDKEGNLTIWTVITEGYYAQVEEFRKFIFFDDIFDIFEYTNDIRELQCKGESTQVITILDIPGRLIDEIYKYIKERKR